MDGIIKPIGLKIDQKVKPIRVVGMRLSEEERTQPLPAATAPAGPAPAQAVASAPVIPSAPASPVAAAPIAAPSAEPAPAAPPSPRFGQPGYNPLLHGGASSAPIGGVPAHLDRPAPTMSEVRARQSAPAAQAQAPVNPVMEPEKMPQANDPLTVAFGPEGERMRAGIDQFIDEPSAPMSETERRALLLTGGAATKVRGALQLVGRAGNIFEAGGEPADEPEIRAKTMRDTLLQPFRRLRAHTEEPWQIEIDRARAIYQTVDGAMKKFGAPGAFAAQFGIMGYELAVNIAMLKTITGASPWASSGSVDTASKGFMKAWAARAAKEAPEVAKMFMWTYTTTPGTHEERMRAAKVTVMFRATPMVSMGMPTNFLAMAADTALNQIVSLNVNPIYKELVDSAKETAKQRGLDWDSMGRVEQAQIIRDSMTWQQATDVAFDVFTNVLFSLNTKSATNESLRGFLNEYGKTAEAYAAHLKSKGINVDATHLTAEGARQVAWLPEMQKEIMGAQAEIAPKPGPQANERLLSETGLRQERVGADEKLDTTRAAAAEALGTPRIGAEAQMEAERGAVPVSGDAWRQTVGVEAPSSAARVNPLLEPERVAQAATQAAAQAERPAEPQAEAARPAEQVAAPEAARPPIEQARDAVDAVPPKADGSVDMEARQRALDEWKAQNPEAVREIEGDVVVAGRGGREAGRGSYWTSSKSQAGKYARGEGAIGLGAEQTRPGSPQVIARDVSPSAKLFEIDDTPNPSLRDKLMQDSQFAKEWRTNWTQAEPTNKNLWDAARAARVDIQRMLTDDGYQGAAHRNYVTEDQPQGSRDVSVWDETVLVPQGQGAFTIFRGQRAYSPLTIRPDGTLEGAPRQAPPAEAAPEPMRDSTPLAARYTPEQLAEMKAEQEKRIGEMRGPGEAQAQAQDAAKPPKRVAQDTVPPAAQKPVNVGDVIEAKSSMSEGLVHRGRVTSIDGDKVSMINQDNAPVLVSLKDVISQGERRESQASAAPRTAADLAKPAQAQEPARVAESAQEPAPEKTATPLAKAIAEAPQAFRVTSSRGNVHNVKMPDGVIYPIRAESKAEAVAKAQELASRTPEDVIDDSIRMVEDAKAQEEKGAKGGYVSTGAAAPVERVLRRAMEGFFGHMRAFGEQYVSDRPLMRRFEQAYHERAAAVETGISDVRKILSEAGPRSLKDSVAVAVAIEEGASRDTLPESARRLYDLSKQTMDAITELEKATGVLKKGFPEGTRDALNDKIAELQAKRKMSKADMEAVSKLQEELAVLDKFAAYLPHGIVARRVMQKIFEEGNERARRDIGNRLEQFHHQRKGRSTLREYLEAGVIRPDDMDIGKLMMDSAVSAYQKISMKALMDYGIENKYIRFGHKAPGDPKEWFEMPQLAKPAQVFKVSPPSGQKVWVHRLFGLGLEELSGAQNKPTTAFDKVLSIVKVGQFYNPKIIWSYNLQQRIYGGAVEWNPVKDAINTKDAWRAVLTDNEDYQQANRLGIFQVPDNLPRATVDSQIDIATRSMRTDLSRGGVIGNQLVKVLERATGEKMDPQSWKDKNLRAALDAIMLPLRSIANATWTGDKVQRMHTFYNLTRRGMSPQDAAEQTARIHGAYSKIGKEYKAWARRVFFVHSFRLLMPIQTMRAYTTPIKIALKALTGKDIPQGETRRAIMALAGTVLFPTLIDSALRYNGWTPTEEEEEFFKKGPMKYLRIPVGKDGYRVTLALPNWKYKKTFMYDGEEREVVLGVNNIANMATKWIMRAAPKDNIVSPTTKDLPIMTLLKWEISPLYRIGMDIFDNNSSFGTAPPRGSTGKDWDSAVGYLFGNIWRMYGDAYRMVSDDRESDVYKERQRAEMMEAMNLGDRVLQNVFGYAYTRAGPEKRVGSMINALRRSAGAARSTAEIHYKGETLEEKIAEIDILEAKMERTLRRRYNVPRPPAEIVRIITDPGLADNPSKQANAARLVKYGMDGMTAKDLRTAFAKEAREQGWNREMYDSKGKLTAYGRRKLQLSRFIREYNIE